MLSRPLHSRFYICVSSFNAIYNCRYIFLFHLLLRWSYRGRACRWTCGCTSAKAAVFSHCSSRHQFLWYYENWRVDESTFSRHCTQHVNVVAVLLLVTELMSFVVLRCMCDGVVSNVSLTATVCLPVDGTAKYRYGEYFSRATIHGNCCGRVSGAAGV